MTRITGFIFILLLSASGIAAQHVYSTHQGVITFFSEAPVSNVDARNEKVKVELNASTMDLTFNAAMADFDFKNNKMGRDADKKYLEREKFPTANFKGKLSSKIDLEKPGKHPVTVTGLMSIHGTQKKVTEKGTLTVSGKQVTLQADFNVLLKDYNIKTPSILGKEMTADKVLVKVNATLTEQTGIAKKR